MELTARDIHEKQFHDAWRGYNQEEVDDFLDRVAEIFDLLSRENAAVLKRVAELEQALTTSRETEEMLKKTLVSAQQAAEEAIAKAKEKANALVADAQERASKANDETRQRLASVDAEIKRKVLEADREHTARKRDLDESIERLRGFETELKRRLQAFLEQQRRGLEVLTEEEPPGGTGRPATPRPPGRSDATTDADSSRPAPSALGARPRADAGGGDEDEEPDMLRLPEEADSGHHRRGVRSLFGRDEH
jgi:cell division initiation protein